MAMRKRRAIDRPDFKGLPPAAYEPLTRLLSVIAGFGTQTPPEMLDEIDAIAVEGVDPQWQIDQLERILDRWAPKH